MNAMCLQILNGILGFVGHPESKKFTYADVRETKGFYTPYAKEYTESEMQAILEMKQFFEKPNMDLQLLMDTYFPDQNWQGLTCAPPQYHCMQQVTSLCSRTTLHSMLVQI